ncbi:MAG: hypothetical protein AAFQ38_19055, partial [Pseudomonadota bacterium]
MGEMAQDFEANRPEAKPTFWKGLIFLLVLAVTLAILGVFVLQNRSSEGPLVPTEQPVPISVETVRVNLGSTLQVEEKFTGIATARKTELTRSARGDN